MESKNKIVSERIFYAVIFVTASLPIACGYVMQGGNILVWLARVEEVKNNLLAGNLLFFPTVDSTYAYGDHYTALNSNLWLFIPAVIRVLGGSITAAYRIYMLLLNALALFAARKMFKELFQDNTAVFFGVLLFMTCPYRIYIAYDKASLGMAAAWACIPLVLRGLLKIFHGTAEWKSYLFTAAAFAALGYADVILMMMLMGVAVLGIVWYRKLSGFIPLAAGGILSLPGLVRWMSYLLSGGMEMWDFPMQSIADEGYVFGQFFSFWVYRDGHPGLGSGLIIALLVLMWLAFVENNLQVMMKYGFFVLLFLLMAFMSMKCFPWDVLQRAGTPLLRLVSLMETPGICFGFASLAASVLGAYGAERVSGHQKLFVKIGLPLMTGIAAIGVAVYMCNYLTYNRVPMFLMDSLM